LAPYLKLKILKIIDKLSTMTRAMRDEYKGGGLGFRVFLQRKTPPWMKYNKKHMSWLHGVN
jgi:hypothetical protein